jgi:hypothetical protein
MMDTPTTVPELRRLLDAVETADNPNTRFGAMVALSDALFTLERDAAPTLAALLTALEAAQNGCATCIEAMDPYSDTSLEACERIRGCTHARTRAALAPLFPKEDDDE